MADIDRQIEQARKKPLTAENLNYIGDLYLKKGDTQRAVMFFYEAADKLHYAQKDKKIAIYKKVIKISPSAEKAYIEIIEILSKMGLVMEEKKYLHLLGKIYEQKGDRDKAEELLSKVRELDPHVSMPGSFFHAPPPSELRGHEDAEVEESPVQEEKSIADELPAQQDEQEPPAEEREEERATKLIEASIEEFVEKEPTSMVSQERIPLEKPISRVRFPLKYVLFSATILVLVIAAVLFLITGRSRQKSDPVVPSPVSSVQGDFLVTVKKIEDPGEVSAFLRKEEMQKRNFAEVSIKAMKGCLPDAFASSPHAMISLLDDRGVLVATHTPEGLKSAVRVIYKTGVCAKERGAVYVRCVLPLEQDLHYTGISIQGLQREAAPIVLKWGTK